MHVLALSTRDYRQHRRIPRNKIRKSLPRSFLRAASLFGATTIAVTIPYQRVYRVRAFTDAEIDTSVYVFS